MSVCHLCRTGGLHSVHTGFDHCMRSDGLQINEPLFKSFCEGCHSLTGQNQIDFRAYCRSSGDSVYEIHRHKKVANGIYSEILNFGLDDRSVKVLEVGAASFLTSYYLSQLDPRLKVSAIEPSPELVPEFTGITIIVKNIFDYFPDKEFDVCFSNQVIEHTPSPADFLAKCSSLIRENGYVIVCCPDTAKPSPELLFSDHLFHFTEKAMKMLAERSGLSLVRVINPDWDPASALYVFQKMSGQRNNPNLTCKLVTLKQINDFYKAWRNEDKRLVKLVDNSKNLVMFGAGEFAQLLRTYTPHIYEAVDFHVVDDVKGVRELEKAVISADSLSPMKNQVLLGLAMTSREIIKNRLLELGFPESAIIVPRV